MAPKTAAPSKAAAAAPKKTAPKQAAAPKVVAKTVAVKKAAPRRTATRVAVPTPSARRGRPTAPVRKAPVGKLNGNGPQVFTVSHLNQADFKADGLRPYAQYRDLGIAAATGGLCQAHVIRLVPPCTDEVRKRHVHQAELQLVYVLKGWMKNEFEGHGEQMMSVGSCWLQPTGIKHTVLDYSPDCEVLEIIVPADFKTEELT
ncbi:MAG TPA: cupin [Acetobacteraceae bacterium]|nr:cupin [Acetobacteraceae bacterium]